MAQWRGPPAGGGTKNPFGCPALVEVGVTVTLDFGIPKHLVALFIRNCPRRYCYSRSVLGGARRVGAAALRELGRLERTLFTLDWLEDAELRRQTSRELNKGETRNSLARAVFIHRLGEIRDRTYANQQYRASGLNLLVTAIILWNTRYLERAVAALRQAEDVPDQLLAHLSPLGWEHVNLTGDYIWSAERPATENSDGFRPLRAAPDTARKAA